MMLGSKSSRSRPCLCKMDDPLIHWTNMRNQVIKKRNALLCVASCFALPLILVAFGCRAKEPTGPVVEAPPEDFESLLGWAHQKLLTPPPVSRNAGQTRTAKTGDPLPISESSTHKPIRLRELLSQAKVDCAWQPVQATQNATEVFPRCSWSRPGRGIVADVRPIEGREYRCLSMDSIRFDGRTIGEIRLRGDFGQAREFILAWSTPGKLAVPCLPDDGMITRRISTDALSDWKRDITYFLVGVPASEEEDFEIEFLTTHPAEAAYPEPVGSRRVRRGRELRQVLYAHCPASIVFAGVALPENGRLQLGMTFEGVPGARVTISLRAAGKTQKLIETELTQSEQWIDVSADLRDWGGRHADVVFRADGDAGTVVSWSEPLIYVPQENPPRVLVYLIDTLGATHVSLYGYEYKTTPNLDALAERGAWFANTFANASRTMESVPNAMLSLPTITHGVKNAFGSIPSGLDLLAEDFQRAGYATACFSTNVNVGPRQNLDQGFDDFFDYFGYMRAAEQDLRTIPMDDVVSWFEAHRDRPVFLWVHTAEPHASYVPPPPFDTLFDPDYKGRINGLHEDERFGFRTARTPRDLRHVVALYDGEVAFADHQFGEFLKRLADLELSEGLITVVTSDHGEQFLEHGAWKHGRDVHGELIRVPLIIAGPPDRVPARRVDAPVQLLDLRPTLLDLCGISTTSEQFGDSLRPLMNGEDERRFLKRPILTSTYQPFPAHHALIRMPFKIMFYPKFEDVRGSFLLYNVETDPAERENLLDTHTAEAAELIVELVREREKLPRYRHGPSADGTLSIDQEQIEQLKSFGYLTED